MVGAFLKGELNSTRFSPALRNVMNELGADEKIITEPDLQNESENLLRKRIFGKFRGYGENQMLFEGFPQDVQWKRVKLSPQEVLQIHYITYSYWDEISKQTHSPVVAAETIRSGVEIFGQSNEGFLNATQFLRDGGKFPELVLVAKNETAPLTVLEGHLRLTAYALAPQHIPNPLTAIVGFSENMN